MPELFPILLNTNLKIFFKKNANILTKNIHVANLGLFADQKS